MGGTARSLQRAMWAGLADGWRKHDPVHRRCTAGVTARMVAGLRPGDRVLDIACGTGDPTLAAAARVGPTGYVLGVDLAAEMLEVARELAAADGLGNVELRCGGGEWFDVPPGSFDRVTIRWGLMFMPDPAACLAASHRALRAGGVLAAACWASPAYNPWATVLATVLRRHVDVPRPPPGFIGPFSLDDPERLRALIVEAGFEAVSVEAVQLPMSDFERGADFVEYRLDTAGPLASLFRSLPVGQQEIVAAEMAAEVERIGGGRAHLDGLTWLALARRAGGAPEAALLR
jgi:ubiquinone/menaquinone biosynthesis C-methylase UbiE